MTGAAGETTKCLPRVSGMSNQMLINGRADTGATEVAPGEPATVPAAPEPPVTVVRPPCGWHLVNIRELYRHRELLFFLVWRDVKIRYKQTVLGVAWAVLQPVMMMAVFTV